MRFAVVHRDPSPDGCQRRGGGFCQWRSGAVLVGCHRLRGPGGADCLAPGKRVPGYPRDGTADSSVRRGGVRLPCHAASARIQRPGRGPGQGDLPGGTAHDPTPSHCGSGQPGYGCYGVVLRRQSGRSGELHQNGNRGPGVEISHLRRKQLPPIDERKSR